PDNFVEGIIAPGYTQDALKMLKERQPWGKRLIILKVDPFKYKEELEFDIRRIKGGLLVQEEDKEIYLREDLKTVTKRHPTHKEMEDLNFAWKVCKYVKSNAILIAKDKMVVGVGAGQMSRIDAALIAIRKAGERCEGAVLASDAFFPFPDVVEEAAKAGITAIIQPGGSIRDKKVIEVSEKYNIAMVFTGMRHFLH
ncbi:MAG TPA: bifunctional phosphoribosylaminoimidazolecarboxamide formyltransferase/IMP cyclohydrolase, partial [Candidatus Aerophobetes bacterium]|nr:bifunctional phosphoribosylaminoimidazolecarboxamide formyltransferase/IMP cyclohydrolase [Candidatus Aerophobetes bacterium]